MLSVYFVLSSFHTVLTFLLLVSSQKTIALCSLQKTQVELPFFFFLASRQLQAREFLSMFELTYFQGDRKCLYRPPRNKKMS